VRCRIESEWCWFDFETMARTRMKRYGPVDRRIEDKQHLLHTGFSGTYCGIASVKQVTQPTRHGRSLAPGQQEARLAFLGNTSTGRRTDPPPSVGGAGTRIRLGNISLRCVRSRRPNTKFCWGGGRGPVEAGRRDSRQQTGKTDKNVCRH
jgi:hypothetical protein